MFAFVSPRIVALPVTSPVRDIVRAVAQRVDVDALPVTLPVSAADIVPALKFPEASLATSLLAVLALVAPVSYTHLTLPTNREV